MKNKECKTKINIEINFDEIESCELKMKGEYIFWNQQKELIIEKLLKIIRYVNNQNGIQGNLNIEDKDSIMKINETQKFEDIINELDLDIASGEFDFLHLKDKGIVSRQIGALIKYLIKKDIIK